MRRRRKTDTEPNLFSMRCETCGSYLVPTPSSYLACPNGHGKLQTEGPADLTEPVEVSGLWCPDEE